MWNWDKDKIEKRYKIWIDSVKWREWAVPVVAWGSLSVYKLWLFHYQVIMLSEEDTFNGGVDNNADLLDCIGVVSNGAINHPIQIQYSSMCIYVEKMKTGIPKYIFTLEMIV